MSRYKAYYSTDVGEALYHFDADTPGEALGFALDFCGRMPDALQFNPHDGLMPLDVIEIDTDGEERLAVWQSEKLRLITRKFLQDVVCTLGLEHLRRIKAGDS